jgi:hypothetical protein
MMAPAVLKARIQGLVDMLKLNLSIHTIPLADSYREHERFRRSVIPYLERIRLRPRVRAIKKTPPFPYRAKVLGRALVAARTDASSFWMLLSGNAEVAFPSTTANLPAPATAAATATAISNTAAAAAATTAVTVTAVRTASTTGASAAANVATPTACQKQKARPKSRQGFIK